MTYRRQISQWTLLALLLGLTAAGQLGCGALRPRVDKLTFLITGNSLAYVKNCGCATGQTGGVLRQMRMMRQLREKALEKTAGEKVIVASVLIEMGNFSDPATPVKRIESEMVVRALRSLHYDAVGLGGKELTYPQQDLLTLLAGEPKLPLTCCNLTFTAPKPSFSQDKSAELNPLIDPYKIVALPSGFKVGVLHAIQPGPATEMGEMYGYELQKPADAAARILEQHGKEADYWLMTLADADSMGSTPAGVEALDELQCAVGFSTDNPRPGTGTEAVRPVFVAPPYDKAKDVLQLVQYFDGGRPGVLNADRHALPADLKYDEELAAEWDGMQVQLEQLAADEANALILSRRNAHPPFHVGQNNCIECHKEIVEKLAGSKHNRAYVTLVEKQVETNASCVKCHVVGYGAAWGWNVKENQPNLQGVQCENCHGPASYHLDLYKKKIKPADLQADGRDEFGLLPAGEAACVKCHDVDNSPGFSFKTYWEKIKH